MKRSSYIFTSLAALALAVCIAVPVYTLALAREACAPVGEVTFGERAAAEGVHAGRVSMLADRLVFTMDYDAFSGTESVSSRWHLTDQYDYSPTRIPRMYIDFGVNTGLYSGADSPTKPWELALLGDAREAYEAHGEQELTVDLSDYLDTYDVGISFWYMSAPDGSMLDFDDPLDGVFDVAVPDDMLYSVYVYYSDGLRISVHPLSTAEGSYVLTPEGSLYFALAVTNADGEHPDGASLPGGGWGVWRMPCTVAPEDRPESERWWLGDDFRAEADPAALENVYLLPDGWENVHLELSYDGTRVLVYTVEGGSIWLTVLDAATGESVQRFELFPEGALAAIDTQAAFTEIETYAGEDWAVCVLDGRAAALSYDGGQYALAFTADILAATGGEGYSALDCAFDGERLAVFGQADYGLGVLGVYTSRGLTYAERLSVVDHRGRLIDEWRVLIDNESSVT